MRAAAIYDIHGNLPALEAVLEQIAREHVDRIVVGGDVVCGPMTAEVMERLLQMKTPIDFIKGKRGGLGAHGDGGRGSSRAVSGTDSRSHPLGGGSACAIQEPDGRLADDAPPRHRRPRRRAVLSCHAARLERDLPAIHARVGPVPIFEAAHADVVVLRSHAHAVRPHRSAACGWSTPAASACRSPRPARTTCCWARGSNRATCYTTFLAPPRA